jgi:hypothetical protein
MPRKPKTPCKHHSCAELTQNRYCENIENKMKEIENLLRKEDMITDGQ